MTETTPVVYLLHGEDEFAIANFISEMETRLGDPATASLNITRLDGRTYNLDELLSVATVLPFLAKRRLVILFHPLSRLTNKDAQAKFLSQLEKIPVTTALVLVEYHLLTSERDRREGRSNWLEKWASNREKLIFIKAFPLPKGASMAHWIQDRTGRLGGQITPQAAEHLASLVSGDPRLADQEIQKLLAFVNYQRPVEVDDVTNLTVDANQGDIFRMVDSLAMGDGYNALGMLRRLLEYQEAISIFGMIVRQFRLLILTRELLDNGRGRTEAPRELGVAPFLADKLILQASRFTMPTLEVIFHRLLEVDEAMKTSQMPGDLALETLVASFTTSAEQYRNT
jgi:DNA polymerase-3 subunit delta